MNILRFCHHAVCVGQKRMSSFFSYCHGRLDFFAGLQSNSSLRIADVCLLFVHFCLTFAFSFRIAPTIFRGFLPNSLSNLFKPAASSYHILELVRLCLHHDQECLMFLKYGRHISGF